MPDVIDSTAGFRRPTGEEQARIRAEWENEIRTTPSGKGVTNVARIFGTVLTVIGATYLVREPRQVASGVIVLLVATVALFFARMGKNAAKENKRLLEALVNGDYLVADAFPTRLWFHTTRHRSLPWVDIPAGNKVHQYRLPEADAAALSKTQRPAVLLIRVSDCPKRIAVLRR